jgi:outer membrane protein assembly factor BamB
MSFGSSSVDYYTIAYNASTGAKLWAGRYSGLGYGASAEALAVSSDGTKVFVTGSIYGLSTSYDYATIAYDASTGTKLWVRHYNGPANDDDEAFSLAVSPNGAMVFVTGESTGSSSAFDYATIAYSTS